MTRKPNQTPHALQSLFHSKHRVAVHHKGTKIVARADARIALHQIQEIGRVMHSLPACHIFRHPAHKAITPQTVPRHQFRRSIAHRLQPLKLKRQMRRQLVPRRAGHSRIRGQEQPRLQESQPSGHNEVIGGQFDAQLTRFFNKVKILNRKI